MTHAMIIRATQFCCPHAPIGNSVGIQRTYDRFAESDDARSIKAEMGLVEFITTAAYIMVGENNLLSSMNVASFLGNVSLRQVPVFNP